MDGVFCPFPKINYLNFLTVSATISCPKLNEEKSVILVNYVPLREKSRKRKHQEIKYTYTVLPTIIIYFTTMISLFARFSSYPAR